MPKLIPDDPVPTTNGSGPTHTRIVINGKETAPGGERLGVNLIDLDRIPEDVRAVMGLVHLLDLSQAVRVDKTRPDEIAILFRCPLIQAAALLDIIRQQDKMVGDYPTRAYLLRAGGKMWTKIPGETVLSLVGDDGKCRLNPRVFRMVTLPNEIIPLPPG